MKYSILLIGVALIGFSCGSNNKIIEAKPDPVPTEMATDSVSKVMDITIDEMAKMNEIGDPYQIENAEINGDILILNVSYGGGCKEHEFKMMNNFAFFENVNEDENHIEHGTRLTLFHNGNDDRCRSIVRQVLRFDLTKIQDIGQNKAIIQLTGWESPLVYAYTVENR